MLQRAVEAELEEFLARFDSVSLLDGRRAVVRNGHLPEREILTAVGPVAVEVPKVRDRSGAGVKFNAALVPPSVRRPNLDPERNRSRVEAALPWLYLKGVSSGDLSEALEVLVAEGGPRGAPRPGPNAAEGPVERGVPGVGPAGPRGQALRLLVGRRHLHHPARERPPLAMPAGRHRGERRRDLKEWVAIEDGLRESTASRLEVLRGL
jgi:hypothetical protein